MLMRYPFGVAISLCLIPALAMADSLSLPLHGYFHPGRAMPVRWNISRPGEIDLSANDAMGVNLPTPATLMGTFPFLVVADAPQNLHWQTPDGSGNDFSTWHPLDDATLLIGITTDDPGVVDDLDNGRSSITIPLDISNITGPPMAWETLDALVLSPQHYSDLPPSMAKELLAAGVMLAVTGDSPPDTALPWIRRGRLWTITNDLAMPPIVNPDAFTPTLGWTDGRGSAFRTQIALLGAIFCLIAIGISLWKSRWAAAAIIALCAVASIFFWQYNDSQSPIAITGGPIFLGGPPISLQDDWRFACSHDGVNPSIPISGIVQPIVEDESDWNKMDLHIECEGAGHPIALIATLQPDQPLALVDRQPADFPPSMTPVNSPLRLLVTQSIYPDFSVAGQTNANAPTEAPDVHPGLNSDQWPGIVLSRQ
jgi:hypothetical protein